MYLRGTRKKKLSELNVASVVETLCKGSQIHETESTEVPEERRLSRSGVRKKRVYIYANSLPSRASSSPETSSGTPRVAELYGATKKTTSAATTSITPSISRP